MMKSNDFCSRGSNGGLGCPAAKKIIPSCPFTEGRGRCTYFRAIVLTKDRLPRREAAPPLRGGQDL